MHVMRLKMISRRCVKSNCLILIISLKILCYKIDLSISPYLIIDSTVFAVFNLINEVELNLIILNQSRWII